MKLKRELTLLIFVVVLYGCGYAELAPYNEDTIGDRPSLLQTNEGFSEPLLVVVRYPAVADRTASERIDRARHRFDKWHKCGVCDSDGIASLTLAKSAYYAIKYAELLRREIPGIYVVTEPGIVDVGASGRVFWGEYKQGKMVPSVLVDFLAHVDSSRPTTSINSTSGLTVNPQISIRVSPEFSQVTNGLVATTKHYLHIDGRRKSGGVSAYEADGGTYVDVLNIPLTRDPKLFYFDLPSAHQEYLVSGRPWEPGKVVHLRDTRVRLTPTTTESDDPYGFSLESMRAWVYLVADALAVVQQDSAVLYAAYAKEAGLDVDSLEPSQLQVRAAWRDLYKAECKFLVAKSLKYESTIVGGQSGELFRDARTREASDSGFIAQSADVLQASLVAEAAGGGNTIAGTLAGAEALQQKQDEKAQGFVSSTSEQLTVAAEVLGIRESVEAASLRDFRGSSNRYSYAQLASSSLSERISEKTIRNASVHTSCRVASATVRSRTPARRLST